MKKIACICILFLNFFSFAQQLKPTADLQEIEHSLYLAEDIHKPYTKDSLFLLTQYENIYRSPEMGLTNQWGLYYNKESRVAEIVIRGSVNKGISWLANYYAAMVPANGTIFLTPDHPVSYRFSDDDKASVHAGWTIASVYLLQDIKPKIDSLYQTNNKEILISGHSQGGVIAYLITAQLKQWQKEEILPRDILFKTYTLAAPKPGNNYFAYQYEKTMTQWSYSIVNTQDWVPEVPPTTQRIQDFNPISPFSKENIDATIKKVSWPKRWFARGLYNRVSNPTKKSVKRYAKLLGPFLFKQINKTLPDLQEPTYRQESNYSRCGNPIILDGLTNQAYLEQFNKPENIMSHHLPNAYLFLLKQ